MFMTIDKIVAKLGKIWVSKKKRLGVCEPQAFEVYGNCDLTIKENHVIRLCSSNTTT